MDACLLSVRHCVGVVRGGGANMDACLLVRHGVEVIRRGGGAGIFIDQVLVHDLAAF